MYIGAHSTRTVARRPSFYRVLRKSLSPKSDAWKMTADLMDLNSPALRFSGSSSEIPPLTLFPSAVAASPAYLGRLLSPQTAPGLTNIEPKSINWCPFLMFISVSWLTVTSSWNPLSPAQVWMSTVSAFISYADQIPKWDSIPEHATFQTQKTLLVFPLHIKWHTHLINIHSCFYQDC